MKKKLKCILALVLGLIALYILLLTVLPSAIFTGILRTHHSFEDSACPDGYSMELLATEDGEEVAIYAKIPEDPQAVMIFLSGMTGPSVVEFENLGNQMVACNIVAILLETRGHGASSGNLIGLGYLETYDVEAAIGWGTEQEIITDDIPLLLCGVSMGASAALVACGELSEVDGVIAMSPYVSFEEQFELVAKEYFAPPLSRKYASWVVKKYLGVLYGEDVVNEKTPRAEKEHIGDRPVLICASEQDRTAPIENTRRLEELLSNVTVKTRDSADHLVVQGNQLKNAADDEELLDWIFTWLSETFGLEEAQPAA